MNAIYPLQNAKLHGYHVLLVYFEAMAEKLKGGLQNNVFCNDSALDWPLIHTRHVLTPRKLLNSAEEVFLFHYGCRCTPVYIVIIGTTCNISTDKCSCVNSPLNHDRPLRSLQCMRNTVRTE